MISRHVLRTLESVSATLVDSGVSPETVSKAIDQTLDAEGRDAIGQATLRIEREIEGLKMEVKQRNVYRKSIPVINGIRRSYKAVPE